MAESPEGLHDSRFSVRVHIPLPAVRPRQRSWGTSLPQSVIFSEALPVAPKQGRLLQELLPLTLGLQCCLRTEAHAEPYSARSMGMPHALRLPYSDVFSRLSSGGMDVTSFPACSAPALGYEQPTAELHPSDLRDPDPSPPVPYRMGSLAWRDWVSRLGPLRLRHPSRWK